MNSMGISTHRLARSFGGRTVVSGFDLEVPLGSMVALCGPSGSGKSTVLNMVGLLDKPDEGEVMLLGRPAPVAGSGAATRFVRGHINYLFQSFALVETSTVEQNLLMAMRYVRMGAAAKRRAAVEALTRVGLEHTLSQPAFELSGGEQQRVALARCMVKPGELVLADEPTGSVDVQNRDRIVAILRGLAQEGRGVLVVTHDEAVASACDRVVRMGRA